MSCHTIPHHGVCYRRRNRMRRTIPHHGVCYRRCNRMRRTIPHHGVCYRRRNRMRRTIPCHTGFVHTPVRLYVYHTIPLHIYHIMRGFVHTSVRLLPRGLLPYVSSWLSAWRFNYSNTHTHTHARAHTHTHTHTHARARAHTHTTVELRWQPRLLPRPEHVSLSTAPRSKMCATQWMV